MSETKDLPQAQEHHWHTAAWNRFREIRAIGREIYFDEGCEERSGVRLYRLISYSSKQPRSNTFEVMEGEAIMAALDEQEQLTPEAIRIRELKRINYQLEAKLAAYLIDMRKLRKRVDKNTVLEGEVKELRAAIKEVVDASKNLKSSFSFGDPSLEKVCSIALRDTIEALTNV
jgi:hypothetical protein